MIDEATRRLLERADELIPVNWTPHEPTERQKVFLASESFELLFGGAAGGGKSDALLAAAARYVNVPGYSALLLRRTMPELIQDGGLIPRSHDWWAGTAAKWNGNEKRWTFPSGATVSFGHMQYETDKHRYQSGAWHFIGFDELTSFTRTQYTYLHSRCRRTLDIDVPLRIRAATNPGGLGHKWVFERFIDPGDPARPFIPSRIEDNPHLDADEYRRALANLDETTRLQLEEGIWVTSGSGQVYPLSDANLVAAPNVSGPEWRFGLGIDLGASLSERSTAFVVIAWSREIPDKVWVLESSAQAGLTPTDVAEITKEYQARYPKLQIVMDEGALGKGYGEEMRQHHGIPVVAAVKTNRLGALRHLIGAIEQGHLLIVEDRCDSLLDGASDIVWNADGTDITKGVAGHGWDALRYIRRVATAYASKEPQKGPAPQTPEYWQAQREREKQDAMRRLRKRRRGKWY